MTLAGWITLAVAGIALAGFAVFEIGKSMSRPQAGEQDRHEQKLTGQQTIAGRDVSSQDREQETQRPNTQKDMKGGWKNFVDGIERNDKVVVAISTVVMAAFTAALFLATFLLWRAGERQLNEIKKSSNTSIKAANAAEDSVNLAREISERDQRPWITVALVTLERPLAVGEKPAVKLICHNSGKTPAIASMAGRIVVADELPESELADRPTTGFESKMIFGPDGNGDGICEGAGPINQEQVRAVQSGSQSLFVIGAVTYDDIFKRSHVTRFCFFIKGSSLQNGFLSAYKSGNILE